MEKSICTAATPAPNERDRPRLLSVAVAGLLSCLLAVGYFFVTHIIDYHLAAWLGGVQELDNPVWFRQFGGINWTLSSILGPTLNVHLVLFIAVALLGGFFPVQIITNLVFRKRPVMGRYHWLLIGFIVTWVLRVPMPLGYSLFYHTSVAY